EIPMSTKNPPEYETSGNDDGIDSKQLRIDDVDDSDDVGTCPHGRAFCPVENPDARRADALECFDCFVDA
ncbi:MAG: hypothetical protein ACLFSD_00230, partial [Salinivenus sp.]